MKVVALNEVITDPLAGSTALFEDPVNAASMIQMVVLRLRIFYSQEQVDGIVTHIEAESKTVAIYQFEYIVNELLYELRHAMNPVHADFGETFENAVLKNWMIKLMKKVEMNDALDFMNILKKGRENRPRI